MTSNTLHVVILAKARIHFEAGGFHPPYALRLIPETRDD
jgi:hypothetical protein